MYYLLYALLYPISLLPFPILYGISDFAYFILFKVFKYRIHVVRDNMQHAFPGWDENRLEAEVKKFQKAFCDQWIETLKLLSMSPASIQKRVACDWSLFHQYHKDGKNASVLLGHQFNWEWANVACQLGIPQIFAGVYLPLNNKGFDQLIYKLRSRLGTKLISAKNFKEGIIQLSKEQYILGLIADQNPGSEKNALWYQFLHRPTLFMSGPEKNARFAKSAVAFVSLQSVKRGYYRIQLQHICDDASLVPEQYVTDTYVKLLTESIAQQPHNWLWSHKRWKRQMPADATLHKV